MAETRVAATSPPSAPAFTPPSALSPLESAFARARALLSGSRALDLARLLERWRARSFHVLVVGEFKRGKSTLLDALLGEDLLPTGVRPVTAALQAVAHGAVQRFVEAFLPAQRRQIAGDYERLCVEIDEAGADRSAAVWSRDATASVESALRQAEQRARPLAAGQRATEADRARQAELHGSAAWFGSLARDEPCPGGAVAVTGARA